MLNEMKENIYIGQWVVEGLIQQPPNYIIGLYCKEEK